MTDHLPECLVEQCCAKDERLTTYMCICQQLRACEQRVLDAAFAAIEEQQQSFPDDPWVRVGLGIAQVAVNKLMKEKP